MFVPHVNWGNHKIRQSVWVC